MPRQVRTGLPLRRQWAGGAVAGLGLPVVTGLLVANRARLSYATPVLLVLLLVVGVALVGGLRPAVPAAIAGGLSLNYFFTPPIHRLTVGRPQDLVVLGVYLAVAVSVSAVVDVAARRTIEAARAAAEAEALSSVAGATLGMRDTLPALLDRVRATFGASEVLMLDHAAGAEHAVAAVGAPRDDDVEQRLPAGSAGTLVVRGPQLFAVDRRVLAAFAEAAATALEGRRLASQAATAEAMDRLRTALLAAVGHELRTPLAGAKAAVSSLRQRDITWTADESDEFLQTIEGSVDRLQGLVSNLLDASRLQVGALSVTIAPVGLDEITARALAGVPDAGRVRVDIDESLPAVRADAGLLERVVANLIDNALRYAPGPVDVTAGEGCLHVIDHGPGLPDDGPAIGSDRTVGGVGLGLFVVEGFLAAMTGHLRRDPTPGGGLTMTIVLPT
jgi:two-component system sensor histidine kinase KdpD